MQRDNRRKGFLRAYIEVASGLFDHGGVEALSFHVAAAENLRAGLARALDPAGDALERAGVDHRADDRLPVARVAGLDVLAHVIDKLPFEFLVDRLLHDDALHADARLTRIRKRAQGDLRHR